jgi:hypothetical protein
MYKSYTVIALVVMFCISSCKEKTHQVATVTLEQPSDTPPLPPPPPLTPPPGVELIGKVKITAYLVYNDSTLSDFDILNDHSVALWNVVVGGGDAEKYSEKTRIKLEGNFKNLVVNVATSKKVIASKKIDSLKGEYYFDLKDTGCEELYVTMSQEGEVFWKGSIPFHCGE